MNVHASGPQGSWRPASVWGLIPSWQLVVSRGEREGVGAAEGECSPHERE